MGRDKRRRDEATELDTGDSPGLTWILSERGWGLGVEGVGGEVRGYGSITYD